MKINDVMILIYEIQSCFVNLYPYHRGLLYVKYATGGVNEIFTHAHYIKYIILQLIGFYGKKLTNIKHAASVRRETSISVPCFVN